MENVIIALRSHAKLEVPKQTFLSISQAVERMCIDEVQTAAPSQPVSLTADQWRISGFNKCIVVFTNTMFYQHHKKKVSVWNNRLNT